MNSSTLLFLLCTSTTPPFSFILSYPPPLIIFFLYYLLVQISVLLFSSSSFSSALIHIPSPTSPLLHILLSSIHSINWIPLLTVLSLPRSLIPLFRAPHFFPQLFPIFITSVWSQSSATRRLMWSTSAGNTVLCISLASLNSVCMSSTSGPGVSIQPLS